MQSLKNFTLSISIAISLLAVSVSGPGKASAAEESDRFIPGSLIELPELKDQFGNVQTLSPDANWLIFTHDRASGELVDEAIGDRGDAELEAAGIQYYADISGMPGMVTRFIAMPAMKKLAYSMIISRDDELAHLPRQEDLVTLMRVRNRELVSIEFIASAAELQAKIFVSN